MSNCCGGPDKDSLLARALAGDLEAFCGLAREHEKKLYCQALGLCRDRHLAEDLAQETLLEAWKSLSRYDSTCRFSTWLYAILLHRHQKSLRRKGRLLRLYEGATSDDKAGSERQAAAADPAEAASRKEEAESLRAAVAALPARAREVIQLRFFADASLSEISVALDIPLGTAKSRLHYALMRLREIHEPRLNHFPLSRDSHWEEGKNLMACDKYKQEIALLAAGELPESERDQVERHVAECASCRAEYEALRKLCDELRRLAGENDQAEAPEGLAERVEERLMAATGASAGRRRVRWLAIAAAACVLIGLAVWAIQRAENRHERLRREREAANAIPPPHSAVPVADLPRGDAASTDLAYCRAWAQSPEALDDLLTRDAAILLRPEPVLTGLDAGRFLKSMNSIEEEHNEKHSMRGRACGVLV